MYTLTDVELLEIETRKFGYRIVARREAESSHDLLTIVIKRLEEDLAGSFHACRETQAALNFAKCTLDALQERTRKCVALNAKGTHII